MALVLFFRRMLLAPKSFFVFDDLFAECFDGQVSGFFKSAALLLCSQILAGDLDPDLDHFVLQIIGLVQSQENLAAQDVVIKMDQLVHFLLDKIEQLPVCIKMNGLNV